VYLTVVFVVITRYRCIELYNFWRTGKYME